MNTTPPPPSPPFPRPRGLVCPHCACRHFEVVYTRPAHDGVTRVRACRHCGRRLTTRERVIGSASRRSDKEPSTPV